jgi:hypothetical protein
MRWYFQDEVMIIKRNLGGKFREEETEHFAKSKAYVEQEDKIQYGTDGQPIEPRQRIFLPFDTDVSKGDMIQITKIIGKNIVEQQRKVEAVYPVGSLKGSHLEVVV